MPIYEDDMTHWIWDNATRYKWWTEIRFRAAKRPVNRFVGGTNIRVSLTYGEWAVTLGYLSSHWGADQRSIKTFLEALEEDGMIEMRKDGMITILKVCDFHKYCFNMPQVHKIDDMVTNTYETEDVEELVEISESTSGLTPSSEDDSKQDLTTDEMQCSMTDLTDDSAPTDLYKKEKKEERKEKEEKIDSVDKSRMREEKFFNQIKNSKSTIESIALALHCKIEDVVPLLEDFYNGKVAIEEWHNSLPAFRKHFINWATKRLKNLNNDENSAKNKSTGGYRQYARNRRGPITPDCGLIED
ncbi:MAG: hypothetical protein NC453_10920 [Muribaculum sp.]|nr:hypothetical protein [Muribaculum sp.]